MRLNHLNQWAEGEGKDKLNSLCVWTRFPATGIDCSNDLDYPLIYRHICCFFHKTFLLIGLNKAGKHIWTFGDLLSVHISTFECCELTKGVFVMELQRSRSFMQGSTITMTTTGWALPPRSLGCTLGTKILAHSIKGTLQSRRCLMYTKCWWKRLQHHFGWGYLHSPSLFWDQRVGTRPWFKAAAGMRRNFLTPVGKLVCAN